jgi:hypothetical protein
MSPGPRLKETLVEAKGLHWVDMIEGFYFCGFRSYVI